MRYLFLTIGAPASGKSTFIREHHLQPYTVESDQLREVINTPIRSLDENGEIIDNAFNPNNDDFVWRTLYSIVEKRMLNGETVIIDATHLFKGAFSEPQRLAKEYNYKIICIDFMQAITQGTTAETLELLAERDHARGDKINDVNVLEKFVRRYHQSSAIFGFKTVTPEEFVEEYLDAVKPVNLDNFDKLKIIGDIHSDFSNLDQIFADHVKGTAYVFIGDYLDRGSKPVETFKFIQRLKGNNIFLLRGNHEQHLENWAYHHRATGQFARFTKDILLKAGITDKDMKSVAERLQEFVYFEFRGKKYFVSHAGIEPAMLDSINAFNNENELVMGLSKPELSAYDNDVDATWLNSGLDVVNVHGHRNNFHADILQENGQTITANLTNDNEFRYLILNDDGTITPVIKPTIDKPSFVELVNADPDVIEKPIPDSDDIIAHNFSREVFQSRSGDRWTPTTMSARGFFTRGNDIVGRGFTKFFNVGETPTASLSTLEYPVKIFDKYNGFLAIMFYDEKIKKSRIVSKGGNTEFFNVRIPQNEVIFAGKDNSNHYSELNEYLENNPDKSILFEALYPIDRHIIDYDHIPGFEKQCYEPIAVINNQDGSFDSDKEEQLFKQANITYQIANNREELDKIIETEMKDLDEGVVLRGTNKQLKMKTPFYLKAKELRNRIDRKKKPKKWFYGAESWYDYCRENKIKTFTPELALELQKLEDEGKI